MVSPEILSVACAQSGDLSQVGQRLGIGNIDSAINHMADRMGYVKPVERKSRVMMSSRYFLACSAFLRGQVDQISVDAYPQVPFITRLEVMSIVQGVCLSSSITHKEIVERMPASDTSVDVLCTRLSKTAKAMCQLLGVEPVSAQKGHLPGNFWTPLSAFLSTQRPPGLPSDEYAQEVHRYLSSRQELAANREVFSRLVTALGALTALDRWQQLQHSPFVKLQLPASETPPESIAV